MDEIKYWFFYLINEDDLDEPAELYAYTDNRRLYEDFKNERNMKMFKVKKRRVGRDVVHKLADEYRELYLERYQCSTKEVKNNRFSMVEYTMVITMRERITIENSCSDILFAKIWTFSTYNPELFEYKIQKSLELLMYTNGFEAMFGMDNNPMCTRILYDELLPDHLGSFIHYFGKTLKGMNE